MQIEIVKTEKLTERMERWQIRLPKSNFMEFGFYLEAMEGVGLHRRSYEAEDIMEVDVAIGFKAEMLALVEALQQQT